MMRMSVRALALGCASTLGVCATPAASVQAAPGGAIFHQPAGSLDAALKAYATTTGRQIVYTSALVEGRSAPALSGRIAPDAALRRLLGGAPIAIVRSDPKLVVLGPQPASAEQPPRRSTPAKRTQAKSTPVSATETTPALAPDPVEIVVTGTNIRGQAPTSQLITVTSTDIARSGYATLAEVMAALPQNFGGNATEDSLATGTDRSFPNVGFGSGINLRGLGPDATLVLVNGRRIAGGGGKGDFADISSIPVGAIARVEVLTDGASAIYGSDAVGGVVNMILKKDFQGAETRVSGGTVTRGSLRDFQISQLAGARWATGHILASYDFDRRGLLRSADRKATASSDLRRFGGSDFGFIYGMPGTVLRLDPATGTFVGAFRIPDGQNGTGLTPARFLPGANVANLREGTDIVPRQTRHIGYVYGEQDVGDRLHLFAEGRFAHRSFFLRSAAFFTAIPVSRANPFFVSPTGATSDIIGYSFARELGALRNSGSVRTWTAAGGGTWDAGGDWRISFDAARAAERTHNRTDNFVNTTRLFEAVGATPDNPATAFSTARDGFFNPYGSGSSNSATILAFVGSGYGRERDYSRVDQLNLKADGTLIDLPGGPLRLAIGGMIRWDLFRRTGESFADTVTPTAFAPTDSQRRVSAGFAEIAVPIFGDTNAVPGLWELLVTAAIRRENYQDIGGTTNPKLGIAWKPVEGLRLRGSWSRAFRAPAIKELTDPLRVSSTTLLNASGTRTPVLSLSGGNPDLAPETAQAWSFGAQWTPEQVRGLQFELNWFRTAFRNQIGRPALENPTRVLRDSAYTPFVQPINPALSPADLALVQALIATPGASTSVILPITTLRAIVDNRYVNTAKTVVQGLDVTAAYAFTTGSGTTSLSANMSWLTDFKSQPTPTSPLADRVGTVGNPADLRIRATGGWDNRRYGATLTANYVGRYRDDVSAPARKIAPWLTFDLQLRYTPPGDGILRDLTIALSVTNLFANDPPFVNNPVGFAYDPANADPLGRFASLSVTKRW